MRAGRAHIAWYGGKTYVKAAEIANAEAFAAGVRPGEKDAGYYTYFVVKKDSKLKEFKDVKAKIDFFTEEMNAFKTNYNWTKSRIVSLFEKTLDSFIHEEKNFTF